MAGYSASDLVRGVLTAVAKKATPGFPRSERMKKDIEHLILQSSEEESYHYFLQDRLSSICEKYKTICIRREKLWVFFHKERNKPGGILATEWTKMLVSLHLEISDPITMQSVYQQLLEDFFPVYHLLHTRK